MNSALRRPVWDGGGEFPSIVLPSALGRADSLQEVFHLLAVLPDRVGEDLARHRDEGATHRPGNSREKVAITVLHDTPRGAEALEGLRQLLESDHQMLPVVHEPDDVDQGLGLLGRAADDPVVHFAVEVQEGGP